MGKAFSVVRDKTVSGGADANPNTTPPGAADILQSDSNISGKPATALQFYPEFITPPVTQDTGGTFNWTLWVKDEDAGYWLNVANATGTAHLSLQEQTKVKMGEKFFVQVTSMTTSASHLKIHCRTV